MQVRIPAHFNAETRSFPQGHLMLRENSHYLSPGSHSPCCVQLWDASNIASVQHLNQIESCCYSTVTVIVESLSVNGRGGRTILVQDVSNNANIGS